MFVVDNCALLFVLLSVLPAVAVACVFVPCLLLYMCWLRLSGVECCCCCAVLFVVCRCVLSFG